MYKIVNKKNIGGGRMLIEVEAPRVAEMAQAGQFMIVMNNRESERMPKGICAIDKAKGEGHTRYVYEGFEDTNTYTFTLTPYSADGQAGPSQTVQGAAEDASYAYKYVAETATVTPEVEGAKVSWVNEYHREVTVNVSYKDLSGETVTKSVVTSSDGSMAVGAFTEPTSITVTTANSAGQTSEPTVVNVSIKE